MTFASEAVRLLFHQLPTEEQLNYSNLEERLAAQGSQLRVEAVMRYERVLEVVVRITNHKQFDSSGTDSSMR